MQCMRAVVTFQVAPDKIVSSLPTSFLARQPAVGASALPSASVSSCVHAPLPNTLVVEVASFAPGSTAWSISNSATPSGLQAGCAAGAGAGAGASIGVGAGAGVCA